VVLPDGSIQIPPRPGLTPGQHRAVLVLEEATQPPVSERDRATAALRAAGLLTELSPEEKARAAQSTLTLDEARAILDRAGGKPLSEIVLEMRGPKG
jgi:ABC-type taurine transport system ATPase subunit